MTHQTTIKSAFFAAFPHTVPILAGFLFLGIAYGIYMNVSGFSPLYPFLMSITIFAGSVEFITVGLLLGPFAPLHAFLIALMVNARHLFYGISMLDRYRGTGRKKAYLIFGMCDESFSINYTANIPLGIDRGWFMFFVTLLNHIYWVMGASIGGIFGSFIPFDTKGIEFVMTALFVVIFLEQWIKEKTHYSSLIGLGLSVLCLALFGGSNFILPSMISIFAVLSILQGPFKKKEVLS
jgi:4-azaleucine resistance transporter AzlC